MPKASKKGMAFVLALILLITSVPMHLLANESVSDVTPVSEVAGEDNITTSSGVADAIAEEGVSTTSPSAIAPIPISMDVITYNLGTREINVGYAGNEAAQEFFDEDGNYTIPLEDNAFFPYEVQFIANGNVSTEWFDAPDSTIQIGGHMFSVHTEQYDSNLISQIGVWIDGQYIAAKPEPKTFTNLPVMRSLIPLDYKYVDLDLSSFGLYQFANVPISSILSGLEPSQNIGDSAKVAWVRYYDDDYEVVVQADSINLSDMIPSYSSSFSLELIVGSALQLDPTNIRYIVDVEIDIKPAISSIDIYNEENGVRANKLFSNISDSNYVDYSYFYRYLPMTDPAQNLYLGLTLDPSYSGYTVKAIDGGFDTAEEAISAVTANPALDITAKVLGQNMLNAGTGLTLAYDPDSTLRQYISLVFYDGDKVVGHHDASIYIYKSSSGISFNWLYDSNGIDVALSSSTSFSNGVQGRTYTLYSDYPADAEYYARLYYVKDGIGSTANRQYVTKAVVGHYDTLDAANAAGALDIKEQLFPEYTSDGSGYLANYSGDGQNFTVFAEEQVYKITIKAVDGTDEEVVPEEPLPNPGSNDTYFRVNGANVQSAEGLTAINYSDYYILPYEHDSYFDAGFQTLFLLNDSVDLASIAPKFWIGSGVDIYGANLDGSAGSLQKSGETVQNFLAGPVQYAAAAEDGESLKNYWVTFIKKQPGAKLFVNGVNGPDGAKREVFLTSIHDNIHDIFVANVGGQPLTGLKATLTNAQNIKVDEYWSIGGTNNNTLAAFETTSTSSYAELANVAKVRLLPDGEGDISGTLIIEADGQTPIVITLTGSAGDPKLLTTSIPEAVKYVPYAVQILHNNKYSWNKVTMEVISGTLPQGIELKPNGELYGVPTETGTFNFMIELSNSDSRFDDSTASYTLVVKENTNTNVDASTDSGYTVSQRLNDVISNGDDVITRYTDHVFITEGEISEFIDFWLNGVRLTENTDYVKEEGSTKITVKAQTFQNRANPTGVNTIAAEFRVDGDDDNELKRAAQNFRIDINSGNGSSPNNNNNSGNNSNNNDDDDNSSRPSSTTSPTPTPTPKPTATPRPTAVPTPAPIIEEPVPELPPVNYEIVTTPVDITLRADTVTNIEDGAATVDMITSSIGDALAEAVTTAETTNSPVVVEIAPDDLTADITNVKSIIPMSVVTEITNVADATLRINLGDFGVITLPNNALKHIAESGGNELIVTLNRISGEAVITIAADGIPLNVISEGYHIALPGLADREVLVIMRSNGVEEIVKKSVFIDGVVYAELNGSGTLRVINNSKVFVDVSPTDSFYNSVLFVNSRELFMGVSETEFAPNATMTRAMLATVLHRLEGNLNIGPGVVFNDVPAGEWYTEGIAWASQSGLVVGVGNGDFGLNNEITKEQLVVFMYRYANYVGMDTIERGDMSSYADSAQTSAWAIDAMRWAVGIGLAQDGQSLDPQGNASRALVADTLMRFMNVLLK